MAYRPSLMNRPFGSGFHRQYVHSHLVKKTLTDYEEDFRKQGKR